MQYVTVHNLSNPQARLVVARYCASFLCQLRGLTFQRSLLPQRGLVLVQRGDSRLDAAIHMLFVPIDLGVVWINSAWEVVDVRLARSWRPVYVPARPARYVLEINPERLGDYRLGDRVRFEESSRNPEAVWA